MRTRVTRAERKVQTRAELIQAARRVFLERGFHAASLEEIADRAGYTKGAIYSNFAGKDELFLEVLDAQIEERVRSDIDAALAAGTLEASLRAAARSIASAAQQDPGWISVLVEFWTQASRNPGMLEPVSERHDRALDGIAALLTELAERYGVRYRLPAREVARGGAALSRGMALEWLLDSNAAPSGLFEEMFVAYLLGLTVAEGDPGARTERLATTLNRPQR